MLTFSRRKKKYKNMNHSKKTNINRSSLSQLNSLKINEKILIEKIKEVNYSNNKYLGIVHILDIIKQGISNE